MKRIIVAIVGLCLIATTAAAFWQSRDSNYNQNVVSSGGCSAGTFGTPDDTLNSTTRQNNSGSALSLAAPAITTTHCPDIIYVMAINNNNTANTAVVSGCGLTWNQRATSNTGTATNAMWLFYATASTTVTGCAPTVTFGGTGFVTVAIVAFNDIHSIAPFDVNAAIPNAPNNAACSFTTSSANDILIGMGEHGTSTPDTGFTLLVAGATNFLFAEYQLVAATQSALGAPATFSASICDAIIQGP